jgi:hypothetical protein
MGGLLLAWWYGPVGKGRGGGESTGLAESAPGPRMARCCVERRMARMARTVWMARMARAMGEASGGRRGWPGIALG